MEVAQASNGYMILSVAYIFNSICCILPIFDIFHYGSTGKLNNIPYSSLLSSYLCMCFWFAYSLPTYDRQVIFSNFFGMTLCFACLFVYSRYTGNTLLILKHSGIGLCFSIFLIPLPTEIIRAFCCASTLLGMLGL